MHVDGPPARYFAMYPCEYLISCRAPVWKNASGESLRGGPTTSPRATESAKLRVCMVKDLTDPGGDRVVLANSSRWASEDPPPRGKGRREFREYVRIDIISA